MNATQKRRGPNSTQVLAVLLGAVLGFSAVALGTFVVLRRAAVPELLPDDFVAAQQLWHSNAPANYSIETKVEGMQPATYRVEVKDGQVAKATRNDSALRDPRTLGTWSVPGMFGTMEYDVNANADAEPGQEPLQLRALFHPEYGYPQRYVRLAWGTKVTTSWEVQSFVIHEEPNSKPTPASR